jgi:hypothetical protein
MSTILNETEPKITDWPARFVQEVRESEELWEADDEDVLEALVESHGDMRFGRYIDLNIQQGFYLHPGNGVVDLPEGSDSGYVIGALGDLGVHVHADGEVTWYTAEAEDAYGIEDGKEKLAWALANAKGPWFLTAESATHKYDEWNWLTIRFLSWADDDAFLAAFPEDEE